MSQTIAMVVEGSDDEAFFIALLRKLGIPEETIDIKVVEGKNKLYEVVESLIRIKVKRIIVAEDIDKDHPNTVFDRWCNKLQRDNNTLCDEATMTIRMLGEEQVVLVIPMGLPNNQYLDRLRIIKRSMEDYVIQLLASYPRLSYILKFRGSIEDAMKKAAELIEKLRSQGFEIASSKELMNILRIILTEMPPRTFIREIIANTPVKVIEEVIPLCESLRKFAFF